MLSRAFTGDNVKCSHIMRFIIVKANSIVVKGEIAGYQHFSYFLTICSKGSFSEMLKKI